MCKKILIYDNTAGYWLHNGQIKSQQHGGYGKGGMKIKGNGNPFVIGSLHLSYFSKIK